MEVVRTTISKAPADHADPYSSLLRFKIWRELVLPIPDFDPFPSKKASIDRPGAWAEQG